MNKDRLLLCRPQGGLNDILCQIERACQYAEQFDRTVIVDTRYRLLCSFNDTFSNYFVSTQDRLLLDSALVRDCLDDVEVLPETIDGKISCHNARYDRHMENFIDEKSNRIEPIDFTKDYPDRLLIDHAFRGGKIATGALSRMRLQQSIVDVLWNRVRRIGSEYTAMHIRNTDYRTQYEEKIEQLKSRIQGPIFVATDNRNTLEHCRAVFGADRVHSFANLPDAAGRPIHLTGRRKGAYQRNGDAILDLLMLALGKELILFEVANMKGEQRYSGFSRLAGELKKSTRVLSHLLSMPDQDVHKDGP